MVLKTIKSTIGILFLLFSVFVFSCEEQGFFVKCDECVEDEPLDADLKMKLDHFGYVSTIINVYIGNLEEGLLYRTIQTSSTETSIKVTLNQVYTVTATYFKDGAYYIAVDAAAPRVTYNEDQCNDPCYYIYDREVDLRLKYTK